MWTAVAGCVDCATVSVVVACSEKNLKDRLQTSHNRSFEAWIGKVNHVYYDLSNTNCVLWLLHITFVAVRAYVVREGGCGCCVCACVRVGMGTHMRRLARRSGIHDLTYVQMGVHRHGDGWVGWVGVDGPVRADWHTRGWVGGMGVCVHVDIVSNLDSGM